MRCEVIAVSSEVVRGQVLDTHSAWLSAELAAAGCVPEMQTRVGADAPLVASALRTALARADVVVVYGAMGARRGQVTVSALAEVLGVDLVARVEGAGTSDAPDRGVRHEPGACEPVTAEPVTALAEVPRGAEVIRSLDGSGEGLICPLGARCIYALPASALALHALMAEVVIPHLLRQQGQSRAMRRRQVRTWGLTPAEVERCLANRLSVSRSEDASVTRAVYPQGADGVTVGMFACAADAEVADAALEREATTLRRGLGESVVSTDGATLEMVVVRALRDRGLSVATAESVTGGMVGMRLTRVDGASEVYRGGIVAYDPEVKFAVLGVPRGPVVTAATACAMARGVSRLLGADVGLATTGVAGREPQENYPQGSVFLGLCVAGEAQARFARFAGEREAIRAFAVSELLDWLRRRLFGRTEDR